MKLYPHQQKFLDDLIDNLTYKEGLLYWAKPVNNRIKVGDVAGYKEKRGYVNLSFRGVKYKAHKLIWIMYNGFIPKGMVIDHINRDKSDNRIENLRLATYSLNAHNSDHAVGVRRHSSADCWQSYITVDGKYRHLGNYKSKQDALKARELAKKSYGLER